MSDTITEMKMKLADGSYSDSIPLGFKAENIIFPSEDDINLEKKNTLLKNNIKTLQQKDKNLEEQIDDLEDVDTENQKSINTLKAYDDILTKSITAAKTTIDNQDAAIQNSIDSFNTIEANRKKEYNSKQKSITDYHDELVDVEKDRESIFDDLEKESVTLTQSTTTLLNTANFISNSTKIEGASKKEHDNIETTYGTTQANSSYLVLPSVTNTEGRFFVYGKEIVQNSQILPDEYQEVEYIQSTGEQYIDSGIYGNENFGFDASFTIDSKTDDTVGVTIFGARWTAWQNQIQLTAYHSSSTSFTKDGYFGYGTSTNNDHWFYVDMDVGETEHITFKDNILTGTDGTITTIDKVADFDTPNHIYIFALNSLEYGDNDSLTDTSARVVGEKISMKLYDLRFYDKTDQGFTIMTRHFIPCYKKSNSIPGLYDLVEGKFYPNEGSGSFTVGSNKTRSCPSLDFPSSIKYIDGQYSVLIEDETKTNNKTIDLQCGAYPLYSLEDHYARVGENIWYCHNKYGTIQVDAGTLAIENLSTLKSNGKIYSYYGGTVSNQTITFENHVYKSFLLYYELLQPTYTLITDDTLINNLELLYNCEIYKPKTTLTVSDSNDSTNTLIPQLKPYSNFIDGTPGTENPNNITYAGAAENNIISIDIRNQTGTSTQDFILSIQEPLRELNGTRDTFIKDNNIWYERHYIKHISFDGSTDELWSRTEIGDTGLYKYSIEIEDKALGLDNLICNYFATVSDISTDTGISGSKTEKTIFIRDYLFNDYTIDEFRLWLNNNPIDVEYILDAPDDKICSSTQTNVLNQINSCEMYENITNIYLNNSVLPKVTIEYFKYSKFLALMKSITQKVIEKLG